MVNIVDEPSRCDFILPSVVQQGALSIAISTGGKSPALAKKLREDLSASFGSEYAKFLDIMGELRELLMAGGFSNAERKKIFTAIVESDVLRHLREGNSAGVKECLREITPLAGELTGYRG